MRWQSRNWLLIVAALFAVGLVNNLREAGDNVVGNAVIQVAIIAITITLFVFIGREERRRADFLRFLHAERDAIRAGSASYEGQPVTYATQVRTYHVVVSVLLMSFKIPSRLVIGEAPSRGLHLACSAFTFIVGWWGIPWGPIWTVKTLVDNARGKPVTSVGELIEGVPQVAVPAASVRDAS